MSTHELLERLLLKLASPAVLGAMILQPLELAVIELNGLLEAAKLAVVELQPPQHFVDAGLDEVGAGLFFHLACSY